MEKLSRVRIPRRGLTRAERGVRITAKSAQTRAELKTQQEKMQHRQDWSSMWPGSEASVGACLHRTWVPRDGQVKAGGASNASAALGLMGSGTGQTLNCTLGNS